jgi:hypothetical protein
MRNHYHYFVVAIGCAGLVGFTTHIAVAGPGCQGNVDANACVSERQTTVGTYVTAYYENEGGGVTVQADATGHGTGVFAQSVTGSLQNPPSSGNYGVYGLTDTGYGVYGVATNGGYGVYGTSGSGIAVLGSSTTDVGVEGVSTSSNGGYFLSEGSADGVHGQTSGEYWSGVSGSNDGTGGHGVYGEAAIGIGVIGQSNSGTAVYGNCTNTSECIAGYFNGNIKVTGCAIIDGVTYGTCFSDIRLKKNIQPLANSLNTIVKLRPVTYEWIDPKSGEGTQTGFIAQDVEQVKPEWVTQDETGYKKINMGRLPILLVDSVRTLKEENDDLRKRVTELESGRQIRAAGFDVSGIGFAVGGLAVAGALIFTQRRRRQGDAATLS